MNQGQVIINEMTLSVPGLNQVEANLLGRAVEQHINEMLEERVISQRHINSMELKVEIPQGTPRDRLAGVIAAQICKSLL